VIIVSGVQIKKNYLTNGLLLRVAPLHRMVPHRGNTGTIFQLLSFRIITGET
jgi:hypothetical protein